MKLGELIKHIENYDYNNSVIFDFCGMSPSSIDSSRGYYEHLAIGFTNSKHITVVEFLNMLVGAVGGVFNGYKGGKYEMNRDTEVWVDNYGEWTSTSITHLTETEYGLTVIHTRREED